MRKMWILIRFERLIIMVFSGCYCFLMFFVCGVFLEILRMKRIIMSGFGRFWVNDMLEFKSFWENIICNKRICLVFEMCINRWCMLIG